VPLFQALTRQAADVEGKFNVTSQLAARGERGAAGRAHARRLQLTSKAASAAAGGRSSDNPKDPDHRGGDRGPALGRDRPEKIADYANRTQIITEVADDWKEIPFDQLNVMIRRDADLNISLQDFTLISRQAPRRHRRDQHAEGTPLLGRPWTCPRRALSKAHMVCNCSDHTGV